MGWCEFTLAFVFCNLWIYRKWILLNYHKFKHLATGLLANWFWISPLNLTPCYSHALEEEEKVSSFSKNTPFLITDKIAELTKCEIKCNALVTGWWFLPWSCCFSDGTWNYCCFHDGNVHQFSSMHNQLGILMKLSCSIKW